jgi:hypothetical protein
MCADVPVGDLVIGSQRNLDLLRGHGFQQQPLLPADRLHARAAAQFSPYGGVVSFAIAGNHEDRLRIVNDRVTFKPSPRHHVTYTRIAST